MNAKNTKKWIGISVALLLLVGIGTVLFFNWSRIFPVKNLTGTSILTGTALAEMVRSNSNSIRPSLIGPSENLGNPNHLIHEKSPYLLQHAYNLVDWYPWGPEAFEKARRENKPIFLSIGYSTCHWCYVKVSSRGEIEIDEQLLEAVYQGLAEKFDPINGGFYQRPKDGEVLLIRQKLIDDNDLPSGNSVAMLNLLRLSRMTANTDFEEKAVEIVYAFAGYIEKTPSAYSMLMSAINFGIRPSHEVVIAGDPERQDTQAMLSALRAEFVPNKVVLLRPPGESPEIVKLAEFIRFNTSIEGKATAYVCLNYYCELPTTDIEQMLTLLKSVPRKGL